jgi:hypothetical protein
LFRRYHKEGDDLVNVRQRLEGTQRRVVSYSAGPRTIASQPFRYSPCGWVIATG